MTIFTGSRWKVKDLTYKISSYPTSDLSEWEVDAEIARALKIWSDVTDLTFKQVNSGRVHIDITFNRREHGDGDPFDGAGGTLAHAYFPVYGGDAHFDDSETWTINSYQGTNLLQTATHEFGHSLGLSHSDQYKAVMAPFYRGYQDTLHLHKDDVRAIQILYGKKSEKKPISSTKKPDLTARIDTTVEELCTNATIDSIVTLSTGATYTFRGDQYWKLTSEAIAAGYPRQISQYWDGLPTGIEASFTWTNGKSYFFKNSQYWRFSAGRMDHGYPKLISSGFEGIPDNVDAAFVWSGNGKIYFFKGSQYWKFDPEQKPPVRKSYPKPISNWEGVPDHIDDAIQYTNGYTYFFKRGLYYRFDDQRFTVDLTASPPFPRSVGHWWFGCSSQGREGRPVDLQADQARADVMPRIKGPQEVGNEVLDSGKDSLITLITRLIILEGPGADKEVHKSGANQKNLNLGFLVMFFVITKYQRL